MGQTTWYAREKARLGRNPIDLFRHARQRLVVELLGGQCQLCGYSRCVRNLAFHHVDSEEKAVELKMRSFQNKLPDLLVELKKCILVCHNCHGEVHEAEVSDDEVRAKHTEAQQRLAVLDHQSWEDYSLGWKDVSEF